MVMTRNDISGVGYSERFRVYVCHERRLRFAVLFGSFLVVVSFLWKVGFSWYLYVFFLGCINNANINAHCPVITLTLLYLCTELGTGERNEKERINDLNIPN